MHYEVERKEVLARTLALPELRQSRMAVKGHCGESPEVCVKAAAVVVEAVVE